jgi:hypothetical protein
LAFALPNYGEYEEKYDIGKENYPGQKSKRHDGSEFMTGSVEIRVDKNASIGESYRVGVSSVSSSGEP